MWADNETSIDLIGFKVHSDLIFKVATDENLLPVVIGVFGDWGGGKSSIMKMLQGSLKENDNILCLYFNSWTFEDYEDAKAALISSILVELGEHKKFAKIIKDDVVTLLKRVKWMELTKLGVKHIGIPLALGALTGGAASLPAFLGSLLPVPSNDSDVKKKENKKKDDINWLDLIKENKSKPDILEARKFREDFEKLIIKTNIKSLVVLIDDLDRCLPDRIIETLEAIKLFISVPKTAFIIGADPRIVRHAIATRYVAKQIKEDKTAIAEEYDLVNDYLEKLIQIPYYLPKLSPNEIETYINLLTCQKHLDKINFDKTLEYWNNQRKDNFYSSCGYEHIKTSLQDTSLLTTEFEKQIMWSKSIAVAITEGLKGNPRQIKRMLNSLFLRKTLADTAKLTIRDDVLAKLMVLEYINLPLFKQLNDWQSAQKGMPERIKEFELLIKEGKELKADILGDWNKPYIKTWLQIPPNLSDIDLRDYFWLARDRTDSTLAGVEYISPILRRIFNDLLNGNDGEKYIALAEIKKLNAADLDTFLQLLQQNIERFPDHDNGFSTLLFLIDNDINNTVETLLGILNKLPLSSIPVSMPFKLKSIISKRPEYKQRVESFLQKTSENLDTEVAKAAKKALTS